jgi:TonB family protein
MNKLIDAAFPCQNQSTLDQSSEIDIDDIGIFSIVEDMPQFPGGDAGMQRFLAQNTNYPEIAKANNISGVVWVNYVVNQSGIVQGVRIARSSGNTELDQEALRVVSALPNFTPGRHRGQPVSVIFTVPIRFELN